MLGSRASLFGARFVSVSRWGGRLGALNLRSSSGPSYFAGAEAKPLYFVDRCIDMMCNVRVG